jgi:hypothetical protein
MRWSFPIASPSSKRRYKSRNPVERLVNRIKHYRRVATRYWNTARNYLPLVHLASILVSMGVTVNTAKCHRARVSNSNLGFEGTKVSQIGTSFRFL